MLLPIKHFGLLKADIFMNLMLVCLSEVPVQFSVRCKIASMEPKLA